MPKLGSYFRWAKERSSPKDLVPVAVGAWLLKKGVDTSNEMFVFISLYLFGLVPAWWGDGQTPTPPTPPSPPAPPVEEQK